MKILIVGFGAIGGVYGSLLAKNPQVELFVAVDSERKSRYEAQPFEINGQVLTFNYLIPEASAPKMDLVIFATKAGQLAAACELVKPATDHNTVYLSLLNGITSEEILKAHFNPENVLLAICNGLDATRHDRVLHYKNSGKISFGEAGAQSGSPRVAMIGEIFSQSGIHWDNPTDMQQTLWYKFMINVGMNQVTAVTGSTYGVLQNDAFAQDLTLRAMNEVMRLAALEKINLTQAMVTDCFTRLIPPLDPAGMTSMAQDICQKRPTEVDLFAGEVLRLAKKHQVQCPVNEVLYDLVRILENKNQGSPAK